MPKALKTFRFNPQVYGKFKDLASKNGYTVTSALERFMVSAVEYGLVFPSGVPGGAAESEARILLAWLKKDKYWVNLGGGEEMSTKGRLLQLLRTVGDADLRREIEETLRNKP